MFCSCVVDCRGDVNYLRQKESKVFSLTCISLSGQNLYPNNRRNVFLIVSHILITSKLFIGLRCALVFSELSNMQTFFIYMYIKCVVPERIHTHPMESHWKS